MKKIIDLTENDLKRIVKKVLTERQEQLNEIEPITLTILGAVALASWGGVEIAKWWNEGDAQQRAESLVQSCQRIKMGNGLQTNQEIIALADKYHKACPSKSYWQNCEEEKMGQILSKIKSVPDFCSFIDEFQRSGYGDWLELTDSAMDTATGWDDFVNRPLSNAVRTTNEANKSVGSSENIGTGGSGTSSGSGTVVDLQKILKDKGYDVGSSGIDGKFGKDTLSATLKALRDNLK
jgi:hypothetical protein